MTTKKTSHVNENEVWPKMSLAAFRYISRRKQSPQREVFSRAQALMYLYEQQKELLELDREGGCNVPFHATERDLSKRWIWHRNTVSSFHDKLQELGILDHQKSSTGLRILMKVE